MDQHLTRDNHFRFGYDGREFARRANPEQTWFVNYGRVKGPLASWKDECIRAAKEIHHQATKNIVVCMSGGLDSEIVAESFRLAQIPFTVVIMRFDDDLNMHDISWAIQYCLSHNISFQFFRVNVAKFYCSEEFEEIVSETHCAFPMIALQIKLMKEIAAQGSYPILSSEYGLERQPSGEWTFGEKEVHLAPFRYQIEKGFSGLSGFFKWSPEVILSYLLDPTIENLVNNNIPDCNSGHQIKSELCNFHFQSRPRPKYYGWEAFSKQEALLRQNLMTRFQGSVHQTRVSYGQVIRALETI